MKLQADFSDEATQGFTPLEPKKEEPVTAPAEQTPPIQEIFKPVEQPAKQEEEKPIETKPLDNDQVSAYLKSKYPDRQFEQLEDLFKVVDPVEKVVEKVVDPWEDVIDEEDKAYLNYKRETGRSRKEFEFLNQDLSKLSPLDLAIERVRKDTGLLTLSKDKAVAYLENKLNIDLSSDTLDTVGEIELNGYAKPYREALEGEKEKYRTPLETALKAKQNLPKEEYVELPTGEKLPKKQYDDLIQRRNQYVEDITKAVDSVAATDFKLVVDDNGEKRTMEFKYNYSQEDKHGMLSDATDIDATIAKRYKANNQFNHQGLAEAMWWGDKANQQKVIAAAMQQARAEVIAEFAAQDRNENFTPRALQTVKTGKDGYGDILSGNKTSGEFGLKISI